MADVPNTVNSAEMLKFKHLSTHWWDHSKPRGNMLHQQNTLRVPWIVEGILKAGLAREAQASENEPLKGIRILDVGCGVGFLSEELAKRGGQLVSIDPCPEMIFEAKKHATLNEEAFRNLNYFNETIEEHSEKFPEQYDVVVALEVLDHVDNPDAFIDLCCRCLKPGGTIFFTTFNKTWLAWLIGIVFYEYISGTIVRGGHSWDKFITPEDVTKSLEKYNCQTKEIRGMLYNVFTSTWRWSSITSIHYALCGIKNKT